MSQPTDRTPLIWGIASTAFTLAFPALVLLIAFHWATPLSNTGWGLVRFIAWFGAMAAFVGVFLSIGHGLKQRPLGVLINERNRYSLSRLQMVLWTLLILPSLFVVLLNNVYEPGGTDATFSFNWQLLALMGMSVGSVVTTPMILSRKTDGAPTAAAMQPAVGATATAGILDANADAAEAGLGDLVLGEEIGNATGIDIGRIQMLMMSLMAVVVYGWMIGGALLTDPRHIEHMPHFNETLLGLILISHAGYLTGKFIPSADTKGQTAGQLARVLLLSQKATDLVRRGEQAARDAVPNSPLDKQLGNLLPLARSLAIEVAALPPLVGTDKFDTDAVGRLEGKYEALNNQFSAATGQRGGTADGVNAPKPDIVRDVQRKLAARSLNVTLSGIADAATLAAIDRFLADRQISRADLSPEPYRMFEEMQTLLS